MSEILFFSDEVEFSLDDENITRNWLLKIADSEDVDVDNLNIIFTSDESLLQINKDFLQHDYYTDIITFQNTEGVIDGEIYISVERVMENAKGHSVDLLNEIHRVMAHGLLHMAGYGDKSEEDKQLMRSREDFYLNLRP
jgi:rRNA maturation RNase YbeY